MQKKSLTEAKHFTREIRLIIAVSKVRTAEVMKEGVLPIDMSSISIKFEEFIQDGCSKVVIILRDFITLVKQFGHMNPDKLQSNTFLMQTTSNYLGASDVG